MPERALLQANVNHCRSAQDLLLQTMAERQCLLAVMAEPYRVPSHPNWLGDRCGDVSLVRLGGPTPPLTLLESGEGFVAAEWGSTSPLVVVGCYFSPNRPLADFETYLGGLHRCVSRCLPRPVLVLGDFNAKSVAWSSPRTTARGEALEEWAASLDLRILNRGSVPTCVRRNGASFIDVSFASPSAAQRIRGWRVADDWETLSDHRYIVIRVSHATPTPRDCRDHGRPRSAPFPRWSLRTLDEDALMAAALAVTWPEGRSGPADAEGQAEWLRDAMSCICDVGMSRARGPAPRRGVYWWSREIAELRSACNAARRQYARARRRRRSDPAVESALYEEYRAARMALNKAIRAAKAQAWRDLLGEVDRDPWGRPYRVVMGKLRPWAPPVTESLDPRTLDGIVASLFPRETGERLPATAVESADIPQDVTWSADMGVTQEELCRVTKKLRAGKAPGPDGVPGRVWALVMGVLGDRVRDVFNLCLEGGVFPSRWKIGRLVLLRKEGRPADTPSAYRPVCLLDEAGKLFERVIADRLVHHLSTVGPDLADCQFGFRAGRSTIDAISMVRARSEAVMSEGGVLLAISIDVVNAFNTLPWGRIREALHHHGVPPYLRRIIGAYLKDRWVVYTGRDGTLSRREMDRGVPQGSVLGPILWDVGYDAVLRALLPAGVSLVCYADDTLLLVGGDSWRRTRVLAEMALSRVVSGIRRLGLDVAPSKSEAMWFHGPELGSPPAHMNLRIGNDTVRVGPTMKYLGLTLQNPWRFGEHFGRLVPRAERAAAALCRLLPNLGGPEDGARRLYVGVVRSMLLYGAPIFAGDLMADRRLRQNLAGVYRRMAIRVARGYRTISHAAASVVSGLPPLELVAEEMAVVYNGRDVLRRRGSGVDTTEATTVIRRQARQALLAKWRQWLSEPRNAGQRAVGAILPNFERWVGRGFGAVTFRLCQILTGHGCFGEYLARIGREESAQCHHCRAPQDTAQHTLEVCPAWVAERGVLMGHLGRDLSLRAVVGAMLRDERSWKAMASFCEQVMLQKEVAERARESQRDPARRRRRVTRGGGMTAAGHGVRRRRSPDAVGVG